MPIDNTNNLRSTLGESRVRTKFNVSKSDIVDTIKQDTAELINLCETGKHQYDGNGLHEPGKSEHARLWSLAQTAYEEAAMWAVKAATYDFSS